MASGTLKTLADEQKEYALRHIISRVLVSN
jgi:hypothetical protein